MIIAIDGPAASGKSTLSRRIAVHFGLPHLNTGSLYRAVARDLIRSKQDLSDVKAAQRAAQMLDTESLNDSFLLRDDCGEGASIVAAIPEVRQALLGLQRAYITAARRESGAVIEGRDIGTVICPDADAKLFITASVEARAHRRYIELTARDEDVTEAAVLADLKKRDERDQSRSISPLRPSTDAYLLDTTKLDIEAAFKAAADFIGAAARR
jgi:cytidylate kinase